MDEDTVDGGVRIEIADDLEQLFLSGFRGQFDLARVKAEFAAGADLGADINFRRRVLADEHDGEAMSAIPFSTSTQYHRMGDAGWKDAQGRLWFCGRKSHRVETPDGALYTEQVEPVFNVHARVRRTALVEKLRKVDAA